MNTHDFFMGPTSPCHRATAPVVAYHPNVLASTVQQEVHRLKGLVYEATAGQTPRAALKLWARWECGRVHLILRRLNPLDPSLPGEAIVGGQVICPKAEYEHFAQMVDATGACEISLLNDDLGIEREKIVVLIEHYYLNGISQEA